MTFDALRSLRPISFALIAGLLPAAAQAAEHRWTASISWGR